MIAGILNNIRIKAIHIRVFVLAFCWIIGCVFGAVLARQNPAVVGEEALAFSQERASFLLLALCQIIPVLVVWLIDNSGRYLGVYGMCFLRMLVLGYCAGGIYQAYESAGWLVSAFVMFSAICASVPLFWLALRSVAGERVKWQILIAVVLVTILIAVFDYLVVSAYFTRLILGF